ncbi:MAG: ATP-binding protein [Candidatus Sumerlaeota bacterium]|nr:ATP-binding protein [Candidatus Sumerlaeota bacterium]
MIRAKPSEAPFDGFRGCRARGYPRGRRLTALNATSDQAFAALFARMGTVLAAAENLEDFYASSVELIGETLQVDGCSILLLDPEDQLLKVKASTSIPFAEWKTIRIRLGEGIAGKVAQSGRLLWSSDVEAIVGPREGAARRSRYKDPSFISVPVRLQGEVVGVINADSKRDGSKFSRFDVDQMEALAGLFSTVLATSRLLEERSRANRYFDSILQSIPMGVMAFNNALRLTQCNRAAADFLSFDVNLIAGAPANVVLPDPIRHRVLEMIVDLKTTGVPTCCEVEYAPRRGGPTVPLGLSAWALRDRDGSPSGVILVIEDLTLRREITELRQSSALKNHFLSLISHELRTPMTSIKGAVHLLMETRGMKSPPAQQRILDIIDRNVMRLAALVDDLLEVQLIETQKVELEREPVDIEGLVRECLESRRPLWHDKQVETHLEVRDGALGELRLDRDRIRHVFIHLIDNAFKFCSPGGKIEIRIDVGPKGLETRISNTGSPIPAKSRDQIFQKFYQVESTMTRQIGGSGLGLYLARELARLHGGDVLLERSDEEWTTFLARLPRDESQEDSRGAGT